MRKKDKECQKWKDYKYVAVKLNIVCLHNTAIH